MRKFFLCLFFSVFSYVSFSQTAKKVSTSLSRPKLVVGIVVDQMRWDYLYRYYSRYGNGGFKRLLNDGFSCENTMIIHLPSYTAVGHSCIFTGSVPSINGITGNDWVEQLSGKQMYCTDDSTVQSVGNESEDGKMSPRNLLVSTVTDELRIATNYQSKVVGVSLKDRAAILPAGHTANAAFWFDDASGHFITSTYYMQQLPSWVNNFNNANHVAQLIKNGWNTLYPIATYTQSDPDDVPYEGKFKGETSPTFPHDIPKIYEKSKGVLRQTPFGNTLTLDFAKAAVENYNLGNGAATDFLTINCASTDYVGHFFGPNSIEIEDTYLRLDKDLEKFFQFLDAKVGKGQYTVFLTADHGAAHAIGYMQKHNLPADFFTAKNVIDTLNKILENKFGVQKLVHSGTNFQINFDMKKVYGDHLDFDAIKKTTVEYLQQQPEVQYAVDMAKIGEAAIPEPIKEMIINGYNFKRSGAVEVVLNPGWFESYAKNGTTHGSWNPYDTHIPLVFMGWGIQHGKTNAVVHMTDIAPTVSALLHIQMPNGCIGKPIEQVLKAEK
ncbi:MAG: alkaline phosphatase family protein [Bacteroidetes bacterium]|nr:alkaline phosphatase family protein [Bacteroidota bacterium]